MVVPLPVPLAPELMVSHEAAVEAVHVHVGADAVTPTCPVPALAPTDWLVADTVKVHGAAAACDTVNGRPATESVPLRGVGSGFAATVNWTAAVPVPVPPPVMVTHVAALVAVHAHVPADAVTVTTPDAPVAATD